jgi:ABC-type antimicrobial peptide transport system permease subunit
MDFKELLWLSFKELREKKVRTALTVVMVVIGVASIVALTSQTAGISSSIKTSLNALGPTSIIITSTGGAAGSGFTSADTALISTLPNVSTVIPIMTGSATLSANGQNTTVTVVGISQEGLGQLLGSINIYQGSPYNDTIAPDALVGYDVAFPTALSGTQNLQVGEPATLKVGSGRSSQTITVPVVGILQSYGSSILSVDTSIAFSVQSAEIILHRTSYNEILVKATNTSTVTALSALITTVYGSRARITTTQQLLAATSSIIGSISLLFAVIAGVSLLVAAIGIMNIMLISVFERTHEIGIMKSVGFKNRHILVIFLFQAMIIGIMGGVAGVAVGAGASYGVASVLGHASSSTAASTSGASASSSSSGFSARSGSGGFSGGGGDVPVSGGAGGSAVGSASLSYSPVFTPSTIAAALLVAVIVSIIAGIYPAWRASKMEPIDALRAD